MNGRKFKLRRCRLYVCFLVIAATLLIGACAKRIGKTGGLNSEALCNERGDYRVAFKTI